MGFDFLIAFAVYVMAFWDMTPSDMLATDVSAELSTQKRRELHYYWVITRRDKNSYRRLGTTYRSHLEGSISERKYSNHCVVTQKNAVLCNVCNALEF